MTAEHDDPPSPGEAVRLLAAAEDHSRVMTVVVWLALVTGARRGELCALRWPDLNEDEGDLLIGGSYAVRKGRREVKATKRDRPSGPWPSAEVSRISLPREGRLDTPGLDVCAWFPAASMRDEGVPCLP